MPFSRTRLARGVDPADTFDIGYPSGLTQATLDPATAALAVGGTRYAADADFVAALLGDRVRIRWTGASPLPEGAEVFFHAEALASAGAAPVRRATGFQVITPEGATFGRGFIAGPGVTVRNPTGVTGDVEIESQPTYGLLGKRIGANFNVTTDQAIEVPEYAWYVPVAILVTRASVSLSTAAGGVYTAASKGGHAIVAAAQAYSALTGPTLALQIAAATPLRRLTGPFLYLSLTTAQGAAATADIYVYGFWGMD